MRGKLDGVRILVVDDDPDVLESMDAALQAEGALTCAVCDGNEAVSACQDDPPDLVVLDMMLPKRSGFLVLEKIKGFDGAPIVIMVTANEGKRHQAYAQQLGVDRYLLKPVPLDLLVQTAVELLAKRETAGRAPGSAPPSPAAAPARATDQGDPSPAAPLPLDDDEDEDWEDDELDDDADDDVLDDDEDDDEDEDEDLDDDDDDEDEDDDEEIEDDDDVENDDGPGPPPARGPASRGPATGGPGSGRFPPSSPPPSSGPRRPGPGAPPSSGPRRGPSRGRSPRR